MLSFRYYETSIGHSLAKLGPVRDWAPFVLPRTSKNVQEISEIPEVMEYYLMSGDADYHLRVLVRSLSDFEHFLRHKLTRIAGVSQVTTSFGLRQVVYRTALPTIQAD